jgi:hypothetical protein
MQVILLANLGLVVGFSIGIPVGMAMQQGEGKARVAETSETDPRPKQ